MTFNLNSAVSAVVNAAAVASGSSVSGADVSASDVGGIFWQSLWERMRSTGGIIVTALIIFLLIMFVFELLRSRYVLSINRKMITLDSLPSNFDGTRLAVLSDMHQMRFGERNEELAKRIKREEPDYIMFVGDMGDVKHFDVSAFYDFLDSLGEDIPVILVPGLDDLRLGGGSVHKNFTKEVERSGAVLLHNTCAEMVSGDQKLYIYGFCPSLSGDKDTPAAKRTFASVDDDDLPALLGKCPGDAPVVLLAHDPAPFESYRLWGATLVLSGFNHGGGIHIPFLGGLFSPNGKFMPKYSGGQYELAGSQMFVTRGLGSSKLRLFNAPEVAVLTLVRPDSELIPATAQRISYNAIIKGQLRQLGAWFKSEWRNFRDLLDERLTQIRDFFSMLFGKKRSRFAIAADAQKRRSTYIAPKDKKKKKTDED